MQTLVKFIRRRADEERKVANEAFVQEGFSRNEGYHAGLAAAYQAAAEVLEERLTGIMSALDNAHGEIAKARARAEFAGHWEAARVLLSMQAVINTAKALVYGDLHPSNFEERIRVITWEAENYRPRG